MRPHLLAAVLLGLLAIGTLTFFGFDVADRFVLADSNLQLEADSLIPEGSTVTARVSEQCTESGWTGFFTIKDTCYRIIWNFPGSQKETLREEVVRRGASEGWVVAQDRGLTVLLEKPGYLAVVLVVADEEIARCREAAQKPPLSPEFCGNSIEIQRRQ